MSALVRDADFTLYVGDALETLRTLPDGSADCCVTSPPYWGLRDYGTGSWEGGDESCDHETVAARNGRGGSGAPGKQTAGAFPAEFAADGCGKCGAHRIDRQLGLEGTPDEYVAGMVAVFREVHRMLADTGTLWLNLGDSYAGTPHWAGQSGRGQSLTEAAYGGNEPGKRAVVGGPSLKPKDLVGIPWRVAFALQADGWYLRSEIIWHKPAPMPESVTDRPTKAHEQVFLLTKNPRYFYDADAIREPHTPDGRKVTTVRGGDLSLQHRDGERWPGSGRNARSVWTINPQPFTDWGSTVRRRPVAEDAPDGGKKRTTSPDCPVHGDRSARAPKPPDDGRAADASSHNGHTDARPARAPLAENVPTDPLRAPSSVLASSGSPSPECSDAATLSSTGSRRTGRAPATTQPCTPSAETSSGTGDTSASPASVALHPGTIESRTSTDGSADHPSAHSPAGSDCTCEWYVEYTEKTSHFATYPEALVRRCILAGCPEWVCGTCGKPRERLTDGASYYKDRDTSRQPQKYAAMGGGHGGVGRGPKGNLGESIAQTVGWSDCGHNNYRAGVVFDPFGGSGTTALVARNHGRKAILIELNADYAALAAKRLQQLSLLAEPA